jgi:hypothetical protein
LSTRARITATSFVNEYHWGDFHGDPSRLMERYYDAHLYLTNWGTRHVMLRLPRGVLDLDVAEQYRVGDQVTARTAGKHTSSQPGRRWRRRGRRYRAQPAALRGHVPDQTGRILRGSSASPSPHPTRQTGHDTTDIHAHQRAA